MAGWISSKLKVAENLLQQIDQQAADSLRKNDHNSHRPLSPIQIQRPDADVSPADPIPLKFQLNRKPSRSALPSPFVPDPERRTPPEKVKSSGSADGDWTELLGADTRPARVSGPAVVRQKSVKRRGGMGLRKSEVGDGKAGKGDSNVGSGPKSVEPVDRDIGSGAGGIGSAGVGRIEDVKGELREDGGRMAESDERCLSGTVVGNSARAGMAVRSSSGESGRSDSETDSESSTDSEAERVRREERRKRMERINAEKAAEAIKERENMVARLEGEKQSLEKILEERKKQQVQEASELQTTMMEIMEAEDLEKQRHNSTRMEVLARLAVLESTNAELARSLAATQWSLEVETNKVAEIQRQIEVKKLAHEELRRKMLKFHQSATSIQKLETSDGKEYEEGLLEAEDSFLSDKIGRMKEKAKKIEENITMTKKEMAEQTEVEVQLKGRLDQLTDRLIQKQTQVEALSSEKAMVHFRIEATLRFLNDNGLPSQAANLKLDGGRFPDTASASVDIEGGTWEPPNAASKTMSRIRSAERHLDPFFRQLDALFCAGALFLRKNPIAQFWSIVYLVCLHFWFLYVIFSHSHASSGNTSGAVVSLENINQTSAT